MIAERLIGLRKERGLTQRVVAAGANVTERQYQFYEHGQRKPGYDMLIALADFFGCSIDFLVGRTDNPEVNR